MEPSVTQLLQRAGEGDVTARDAVLERLYGELRALAAAHMKGQELHHSLQPTALVHEVYLRLIQVEDPSFASRRHFLALASRVMRGILVDHARARNAVKRGGDLARVPLSTDLEQPAPDPAGLDLLDLALALEELEQVDEPMARLCELRYLGGLTVEEIATAVSAPQRTVERRLRVANAWLRDRLAD